MNLRHLQPDLDPEADVPPALQLARLVAREIQEGRLRPGDPLPGSRSISEELGMTRHAVMSALRELELEGWVETRPASGTFVAQTLPAAPPRHWGAQPPSPAIPETPAFSIPAHLAPVTSLAMGMLDLSEGWPDARLAPKEALAKAYQRALRRHGDDLLGRGEPRGNAALRTALADHLLASRGLRISQENLLVTRGLPMARTLVATALLARGGHVAVEDPGQREAWETFREVAGSTLHGVPVDEEGLDTDALGRLAQQVPLEAVLVTPQRQRPTTVRLSPARRSALMALAATHGFAILEEDPDLELFGPEGPALPLAATDPGGNVIHLGSLGASLAPGLGLGYLVAPRALVDRLARVRQRLDLQGDRVLEWSLADLIRDGDFDRHLARARQVYDQRLQDGLEAIPVDLGPGFHALRPQGGLSIWLSTPAGLDAAAWCARAAQRGVHLRPGSHHTLDGRPLPAVLLGFGALEAGELRRGLRLLREALP